MTTTEKPATSAATLGRAEAEKAAALAGATCSTNDFNTAAGERQGFVEALLPRGEKNAVRTAQLVALTGYRGARELQKQIEAERKHGALILSKGGSGGGYYLPDNGEAGRREIAAFVRTVNARAVNSLKMLKAARRALKQIDGQQQITEVREDGRKVCSDYY